jgi:hypothetical protein
MFDLGRAVLFLLPFDFLWSSCTVRCQLLRSITFYSLFFHDLVFFICMGLPTSRFSASDCHSDVSESSLQALFSCSRLA